MDTHLVGRILSCDYLVFVPAVAVAFNIGLAAGRRWKELLVFNIGGAANLAAELLMVRSGMRTFDSDSPLRIAAALLCLGWVTNGFVCCLAYMNVRQWLKKPYPTSLIISSNAIYFVLLPLSMADRGFFGCSISTFREMKDIITIIEPALVVVFSAIIYFLGYKKLLWRLLLVGVCLDFGFEASLFISGVRPPGAFDLLTVGGRVLFEMNTMLCLAFLVMKAIFGLKEHRDSEMR